MTGPERAERAARAELAEQAEQAERAAQLVTSDVDVALDRLRAGGLVAIPTETVYGLAADAEQPDAVRRIFEIKRRPSDHPLIVHLADPAMLADWAATIPEPAVVLAHTCWPGPLTLLLDRSGRVPDVVTGGRGTVGIRVPAHPLTSRLLSRFGGGLAAPSANLFGRVSPTTALHVVEDLGGRLDPRRDVILDGGPCPIGVESTIVDCTVDPPQVLRPGGIASEDIEQLLGMPIDAAQGPSRASGMLASHYAPSCAVHLVPPDGDIADAIRAARQHSRSVEVLDLTDDLVRYARELYERLRAADARGVDVVVARLPAAAGLGHAIRDRLLKAARRADPSPAR